jgi:tRNA dimethylallyltransferase
MTESTGGSPPRNDRQPANAPHAAASAATPAAIQCWYLTGPTAAGKTGVGIEMARLLNAEIISLDSMAVYRGMDIGTAKPTPSQRAAVPHHLIDILDPVQEFSVSDYVQRAHQTMAAIRAAGREVLFVGGTPMYLKAMLRGLFQGPPADWEFRAQVEEEARRVGIEALHQRLQQVDPLAASKLHANDVRRIIRALEVYKITGEPISHLQLQFEEGTAAVRCRVFTLSWPRPTLYRRIDARVEWMFASGLVEEVRGLLDTYGQLGRTASQAVGYREVIEALNEQAPWADTHERVKARTHQFARRQETWFRSLCECRRIELSEDATPADIAQQLVALGQSVATAAGRDERPTEP